MMVKLKVDNQREWNDLYLGLKKAGLLESVTVNEITLPSNVFPLEVPIDVGALLKLVQNPMVRPFKKMIDWNLSKHVRDVKLSLQ